MTCQETISNEYDETNPPNMDIYDNYHEVSPLFVDEDDFHLQKDSPCIDKGVEEHAPSYDFDGNKRPQKDSYDIGAYEYCE